MDRYVCIHGHFYQPPRENAWLETIEQQDSAYPYHDWNERITAESYGPNAEARILDARDRIVRIVNNYARISFNFGPTLLSWMREHARETYDAIIDADRESIARFGRGSAIAQAYSHLIMPLANGRDRRTQVIWGARDFEYRFGRRPEGMWLPETGVDNDTLEDLAAQGIRFTILAPNQAAAVRPIGEDQWQTVDHTRIDTRRSYLCRLPSGAEITLFFYNGVTSRAVAFEGLLRNGEHFAQRILSLHGNDADAGGNLAHIATDGETYGHHHPHGEMALAFALHHIEESKLAKLTNYAAYLEHHPPSWEVQIAENTSWSCAHGVERWRSDCGCHTGGAPGWNQQWREPLRTALDWLRDEVTPHYEELGGRMLSDPWAARDDYIDVILDRRLNTIPFITKHARNTPGPDGVTTVLELMELQRHAMLMQTSCGWFFNDVSGIETIQVLQYAGRVVQLAGKLFGISLEDGLLERLAHARSNVPEAGDARRLYEQHVIPARVDLLNVAAHYAVSSLFDEVPSEMRIYSYQVELQHGDRRQSGDTVLLFGRARVISEITQESAVVTFAVLHFGNHNLTGGIRRFAGDEEYRKLREELLRAFSTADLSAVIRELANFPEYTFSLKSLFGDRQRQILYRVLESNINNAESAYRRLYEENASLMRFLIAQDLPLPRALHMAAEFVLNRDLRAALAAPSVDLERTRTLLDDAEATSVQLDREGLSYGLGEALARIARQLLEQPHDLALLEAWTGLAGVTATLPFEVNLWKSQNAFYELLSTVYPAIRSRADAGDQDSARWAELFEVLGEQLSVVVS
jgi:alpha-amylase/alpha-mannosidase (GH57 family)